MRITHIATLLAPLALLACDDTVFPPHGEAVEGEGFDAVLEVVDGNCLGCHSAAAAQGGLDLETDFCGTVLDGRLVVEGDSAGSVFYQRIIGDPSYMPPSGEMDQSNLDIVANWIDDGAECTAGGDDGGATEPTTGPEIFAAYCAGCHGADGLGGASGPDLTTKVPGLTAADVETIIASGSGTMPAIATSTEQTTTVAAYTVETWGN